MLLKVLKILCQLRSDSDANFALVAERVCGIFGAGLIGSNVEG